jgi:hypothetical protein
MALTSKPCEIDVRYEKVKLALDLRRLSGREVQDQKGELMLRFGERIQKISDFWVWLDTARKAVQQLVSR